jgi:hypothetical protein
MILGEGHSSPWRSRELGFWRAAQKFLQFKGFALLSFPILVLQEEAPKEVCGSRGRDLLLEHLLIKRTNSNFILLEKTKIGQ